MRHDTEDPKFTTTDTVLMAGTLIAGFVSMVASGGAQIAAWAIMLGCMTGSLVKGLVNSFDRQAETPRPERENHPAITTIEEHLPTPQPQLTPAKPSKSWVESLDRPKDISRCH